MSDKSETFWLENPCVLLSDCSIIPTKNMSSNEKLNALSRLAIIIAIVLFFLGSEVWLYFLLVSLLAIVCLAYANTVNTNTKENFTVTPTYLGTNFSQTVVSPTFSEEWQIPPPAYDIATQVPYPEQTFETPLKPQSYPYGQYLTRTNLLPSDEYYTHLGCGSPRTAREYVNSTYLRNDLAFRENMTRILKKKMNRRFRHNCQDTFSPYMSY